MSNPLSHLHPAIERRKWILWAIIALVLVIAWFVIVALLPHHVVNALQHYEEQANGLREPPKGARK